MNKIRIKSSNEHSCWSHCRRRFIWTFPSGSMLNNKFWSLTFSSGSSLRPSDRLRPFRRWKWRCFRSGSWRELLAPTRLGSICREYEQFCCNVTKKPHFVAKQTSRTCGHNARWRCWACRRDSARNGRCNSRRSARTRRYSGRWPRSRLQTSPTLKNLPESPPPRAGRGP